MTLPFLNIPLTTTHCLIGAGTLVGLPIVSCGGYYIHNSSTPSYGQKLKNKGYQWDLTSFKPGELKTDQTTIADQDRWKLNRLGCFDKFFPGAEATTESSDESSHSFTDTIPITNKGANTDPIGCILSKIDWKNKDHFTYKSEITVKNDKFGWAIWTHNHRNGMPEEDATRNTNPPCTGFCDKPYDYTLWTYHILFLEKNAQDKWEVKGGYYLADNLYYLQKGWVSIVPPGQKSWIHNNTKSTSYSGIWTTSSKGKEVFEDIQFLYGGHKVSWLGRPRGNGNLFHEQDFKFNGFYNSTSKKWNQQKGRTSLVQQLHTKLEPYYDPFRGKKGKWQTTSRYCNSLSSKRHPSPKDAKRLEEICFRKADS